MTKTKTLLDAESHLLFRRFMLIAICITLAGMLFAQLIAATQKQASTFKVHDRAAAWEQMERLDECGDRHCAVSLGLRGIA